MGLTRPGNISSLGSFLPQVANGPGDPGDPADGGGAHCQGFTYAENTQEKWGLFRNPSPMVKNIVLSFWQCYVEGHLAIADWRHGRKSENHAVYEKTKCSMRKFDQELGHPRITWNQTGILVAVLRRELLGARLFHMPCPIH